ncbi:hypothetical protein V6N13_034275 [Hibiscus sabdariffa]
MGFAHLLGSVTGVKWWPNTHKGLIPCSLGFLEPLNGSDETIGDEAAAEQHNSNNNHKIVLPIPANGGDDGGEKGKGRWCPKLTHTKTLAVKSGEGDVTVTNGGGGGEVRGI